MHGEGKSVPDVPVVLVVEDEYQLQEIVEEALIDGGFEATIASSGEEALTCSPARPRT